MAAPTSTNSSATGSERGAPPPVTGRIPSDHETVESHRVSLATVGRTGRPEVVLPDAVGDDHEEGDVVRLFLGGDEYRAGIEWTLDGEPVVRGAYANDRLARTSGASDDGDAGDATNHLATWRDDAGVASGDRLLLDVVRPGFAYGLRCPGDRVRYPDREPPDDSLADIASDLGE